MSTERKLFWAFLWLALAIVGAVYALRQVRVMIFVVPVEVIEAPAAPKRGQKHFTHFPFRRGIFIRDGGNAAVVTTPAGGDVAGAACRAIS